MSFEGFLIDMDGTLVLSNDAHAQSWVEAFADFGYQVSYDRVRPLIGMGGDQIIPMFAPGLSDKEGQGKEIASRRKELVINKFVPNLAPAKGARELIAKMRSEGLRMIIASSSSSQELSALLKVAKIDDLIGQEEATSSSDAEHSKPDPDLIEVALNRLKLPPQQAVLLGDTPYDIESAKKISVATIAFRCGGFSDEQLKDAIAIYDDPADLVAQYARSPLAKEVAIEA
jgi:HAD superfamily hydrolase (TIGR01509 family)